MSDSLQIHTWNCAGWRDPAGDFAGCSCHVGHAAELLADRDQLRAKMDDLKIELETVNLERVHALNVSANLERSHAELAGRLNESREAVARLQSADKSQDQLRDQLAYLQRQLTSERHQNAELRASKHELRYTQDMLLRHLTQPSRFRLYIQPRLIPADEGLRIILPNGDEVGFVSERILGGYIATAHDAGWAVPFPTQAMAVDWLTELAQYAAWADLQQRAAAQAEGE